MLPDKIIEFVNTANVISSGTRNKHLKTTFNYCFGVKAYPDKKKLCVYLPKVRAKEVLENLMNNKRLALNIANAFTNEGYQLKGAYTEHHEVSEDEAAVIEAFLKKFRNVYATFGLPIDKFEKLAIYPCVGIDFEPEVIFDQTPGPGAGKKVEITSGEYA